MTDRQRINAEAREAMDNYDRRPTRRNRQMVEIKMDVLYCMVWTTENDMPEPEEPAAPTISDADRQLVAQFSCDSGLTTPEILSYCASFMLEMSSRLQESDQQFTQLAGRDLFTRYLAATRDFKHLGTIADRTA